MVEDEAKATTARNLEFNAYQHMYRDPLTGEEERIFSEMVNSDAMLREQAKIRAQPCNPSDPPGTERDIIAMAASSDETMVARFGGESMKPIYIAIPSLTKYMQNNPNAFTAHHLAYVPKVSNPTASLQLFTYIVPHLHSFPKTLKLNTNVFTVFTQVLRSCACVKPSFSKRFGYTSWTTNS